MFYRLSLNGDIHVVEADGDTSLLWVLRDLLGMIGTKSGCVWRCAAPALYTRTAIRFATAPRPSTAFEAPRSPPSRRSVGFQPALKFKGPGSILKSCSVAIASPGKLCPQPRSWPPTRNQTTPISKRPCPSISAAADLPLRHLCTNPRSHQACISRTSDQRTEGLTEMFDPAANHEVDTKNKTSRGVSRRTILTVGAAAGGGLPLSVGLPYLTGSGRAADDASFAPNAFIRIARDSAAWLGIAKMWTPGTAGASVDD
jgi:hypothetical protein